MKKDFANRQQYLMWKAFKGECGEEFLGNPFIAQNFVDIEKFRGLSFEDREK